MQRNKYLDDLGIPLKDYGTNFIADDDKRADTWKKEREIYGFDGRECWNLDRTFLEWLYSRFMKYKEDADKMIVLSGPGSRDFEYKGRTIDQAEAIDIVLNECKTLLLDNNYSMSNKYLSKETMILLGELMPCMWW